MKTSVVFKIVIVMALVLGVFSVRPATQATADGLTILKFGTMVGVPKAYTASMGNPIRGIIGGGLPWAISGAEGKLTASGKLNIYITGLVFDPSDATVVERGLANRNTITSFRAVVSCQTANGGVQNIMTDPFPATVGHLSEGGGNAKIETFIELPKPCIAPIIFATSPGGSWFATTGY